MQLALSLLLFIFPFFASESSLGISRLTGQAQVISGNDPTARRLTVQHQPRSGQKIQTSLNGIVTISLDDGSLITLATDTAITLMDIRPGLSPIILLHQGRVRVTSESESSFYLVTPQAIIKTQKADFHAVSSSETLLTTILVYRDEVHMAPRLNRSQLRSALEDYARLTAQIDVQRTRAGEVEIETELSQNNRQETILKAQLSRPETVKIGVGHFSSYRANGLYPTTPQRISPAQFNLLVNNLDFSRVDNESEFLDQELLAQAPVIPFAQSPARPEGEVNRRLRVMAPKAGGLIDLKSGHYIEPAADAEFYQSALVYLPGQADGNIGRSTGVYYPARGLELGAEGFRGLRSASLNPRLAIHLFNPTIERKSRLRGSLSNREALTKNILNFRLSPHIQTLTVQSNQSTQEYKTSLSERYDISLSHLSGSRWQMVNHLRLKRVAFKETSPVLQTNALDSSRKWLYGFDMGVRFYLRSRVNFYTTLGIEQNHFVETLPTDSAFTTRLSAINSAKWVGAFEWKIAKSGSLDLDSTLALFYHFNKKTRNLETQAAFGLKTDLKLSYWINNRFKGELGGWWESISQDSVQNAVSSQVKRLSIGSLIGLSYIY